MTQYELSWLGFYILCVLGIFGLAYLTAIFTEKKN